MIWIVLILLGSIPIAAVAALIYAYRKLSRAGFVLVAFMVLAVPLIAFKLYVRNIMLSVVPDALDVSWISYQKEETWGFGPGGNEAGIRVYPLPGPVAERVDKGGVEFLGNMPANSNQNTRSWRGYYSDWKQTPIQSDEHWKPDKETGRFDLYQYVCQYGFCIEIKEDIVEEVNAVVNSPGSYYAYGRIGVIIVSPRRGKVFYLYNG